MRIESTAIQDLRIIHPTVFEDSRGYFFESFNKEIFSRHGIKEEFLQDNQSLSHKGVLRGLHFQTPPHAQSKLVRVVLGSVLDVAVDIRKSSPTYGKHISIVLSSTNKMMFYIPEGFAHGFLVLENNTIFSYKCSRVYNKASEDGILWEDSDLKINWGINSPILSDKDKVAKEFKKFSSPF